VFTGDMVSVKCFSELENYIRSNMLDIKKYLLFLVQMYIIVNPLFCIHQHIYAAAIF
jgi:hypothetical protein